jgi:hypothetical protein
MQTKGPKYSLYEITRIFSDLIDSPIQHSSSLFTEKNLENPIRINF